MDDEPVMVGTLIAEMRLENVRTERCRMCRALIGYSNASNKIIKEKKITKFLCMDCASEIYNEDEDTIADLTEEQLKELGY